MILGELMRQPSLADIRGAALNTQARIEAHPEGARDGGRMTVELGLSLRAINLDNPATIERDGRFYTPGEGSTLQVNVNETESLRERLKPMGRYGPNLIHSPALNATVPGVYWLNPALGAPPPVDRTLSFDLSNFLPRGGDPMDIHLLDAHWTAGFGGQGLGLGHLRPTDPMGRALAALYMVDWSALAGRLRSA